MKVVGVDVYLMEFPVKAVFVLAGGVAATPGSRSARVLEASTHENRPMAHRIDRIASQGESSMKRGRSLVVVLFIVVTFILTTAPLASQTTDQPATAQGVAQQAPSTSLSDPKAMFDPKSLVGEWQGEWGSPSDPRSPEQPGR